MKKKGEKLPSVTIEGKSETEFVLVNGKIVPKTKAPSATGGNGSG